MIIDSYAGPFGSGLDSGLHHRPQRRRRLTPLVSEPSSSDVLTRLNVRVLGQGKPPMLFCNGFGCSQQVWRYLTAALATTHQLVLFDYPGTGGAQPVAGAPVQYGDLAGYVADVLAICQALNLPPAVIVGHSVGATIAMLAAIAAPQQFPQVVLLAASPSYLNLPGYRGGFDRPDLEQMLLGFDTDDHAWANPLAEMLQGNASTASTMEELAGFFCEMNPDIARQLARVTFLADNRADIPRLLQPTLVLQCAHDMAVPEEVTAYWRGHLPHGQVVQLPTTGHCPHLSAPTETIHAIMAFLHS
jgi:sigma-B regulation protein RsbQ